MAFSKTWNESTPTDSSEAKDIDDIIRNLKVAIRERLAEEHAFYTTESGNNDVGKHKSGSARVGAGTLAARPSNDEDQAGSVYVVTNSDPYKVYYDTGSDWELWFEFETDGTTGVSDSKKFNGYTQEEYFDLMHPVGDVVISYNTTNPGTRDGWYGTWTSFGSGRVLIGVDSGDTAFNTIGETGGEKTHTLTEDEMPEHDHSYTGTSGSMAAGMGGSSARYTTASRTTGTAGGGQAHNNMQPYIAVSFWRRTE
jgi:hypothetical protein